MKPIDMKMGLVPALLAIIVALCWGFNFGASKFSVLHFPPFYSVCLRYVLVSLLLLPFARRRALSFKQLGILSLLLITMHLSLVFAAIALGLELTATVIIIQLGTPFSCILGAIFLGDNLGRWRSFGMLIAFGGIVVIAGTPNVLKNELAFFLAIAGAMSWAGANIYMKTLGETPVMPLLFWSGLISVPQTALVSVLFEAASFELLWTAPQSAWLAILYSAVCSTIIGYGLWYWLLKRYPISQVTPYALLVPVGGVLSGIVFFDEVLTHDMMIGAAITIIGVAIITIRRPKMAETSAG